MMDLDILHLLKLKIFWLMAAIKTYEELYKKFSNCVLYKYYRYLLDIFKIRNNSITMVSNHLII